MDSVKKSGSSEFNYPIKLQMNTEDWLLILSRKIIQVEAVQNVFVRKLQGIAKVATGKPLISITELLDEKIIEREIEEERGKILQEIIKYSQEVSNA